MSGSNADAARGHETLCPQACARCAHRSRRTAARRRSRKGRMQYDKAVNQPTGNRCPALPKALALGLARGIDTPGQVFMRRSSRSTFGRSVERLFSSLFSSERPNPDFNELRTGHQERPGVARTPNARCCVQPRPWIEKGINVRSFRPARHRAVEFATPSRSVPPSFSKVRLLA
jgi:hypothetical protein